jgi:hypothetical protein
MTDTMETAREFFARLNKTIQLTPQQRDIGAGLEMIAETPPGGKAVLARRALGRAVINGLNQTRLAATRNLNDGLEIALKERLVDELIVGLSLCESISEESWRHAANVFRNDAEQWHRERPGEPGHVLAYLSSRHLHEGQLEQARALAEEANKRTPTPPSAILWKAAALIAAGQIEIAYSFCLRTGRLPASRLRCPKPDILLSTKYPEPWAAYLAYREENAMSGLVLNGKAAHR